MKNSISSGFIVLALFWILGYLGSALSIAQTSKDDNFRHGTNHIITDSSRVAGIIDTLKHEERNWQSVLDWFYGDIQDKSIPNLIIFVDKSDTVTMQLLKGGKGVDHLWGEPYIYVLIFTNANLNIPDTTMLYKSSSKITVQETRNPKDSVTARQRTFTVDPTDTSVAFILKRDVLNYQTPPSALTLSSILSFAASLLGGTSFNALNQSPALPDSSIKIHLNHLGTTQLYYQYGKFNLATNTKNRIALEPWREPWEGGKLPFNYVNFNFENPDKSCLGVGFAVLLSPTNGSSANVYLLAHLYVDRPMKPYDSRCAAFVAGTDLGPKIFGDNFVLGFRGSPEYLFYGTEWCLGKVAGTDLGKWPWPPTSHDIGFVLALSTKYLHHSSFWGHLMLGVDYKF
jgi:hypothetical protein